MSSMRIYSSFDELPPEAARLFDEAGAQCFFHGLPWYRTFVNYALDPGDRVRIYCVTPPDSNGAPQAALAALWKEQASGIRQVRKLSSLSSYYTSLFSPVLDRAAGARAAAELARAVAKDSSPCDVVELKPLDVNAPAFHSLVEGFEAAGFVVQTYFCFGNWYLAVNGRSFAQYLDRLPSALKNTLTRKRKKLERSGRAKIEVVTGGAALEAAIAAYRNVYLASWKQPEPYPEFIPALMRTCAEMGWLRLGLVHIDRKPAAAQFWIVQNGVASIYKLAYDERFADFSAGSILTAKLMEHVLDVDKVREVDYLTGDDKYKRDWMSHRRERWGILAMNPRTLRGALAIVRHVGGRAVKRALLALAGRAPKTQGVPRPA